MKNLPGKNVIRNLCAAFAVLICALFAGCEYDSDGPLKPSSGNLSFDGSGFFNGATLDSGKTIHLLSDTLYVGLSYIWSYSNCALESIDLDESKEDSVLVIKPIIKIHATEEECAAPFYRPDTTLKVLLSKKETSGIGEIQVKNDDDSLLATINLRRGSFETDTFNIYMDSLFLDASSFPLRTNELKDSLEGPTILRVLDSLTPRVFYWRTLKSTCTVRVDMCGDVVADTVYPSSWDLDDTNLVPVHYACADSDSIYCVTGKWENDSTALGKLMERPDTIWYYSTYYTEKIPECATFSSFGVSNLYAGQTALFVRQIFLPDDDETFCGPASKEDWMVYNLSTNKMVLDTGSVQVIDSLFEIWNKADVAPDTLISEE